MSRDRTKNREKVRTEKALDLLNAFSIKDPTPAEAVANIIKKNQGCCPGRMEVTALASNCSTKNRAE